jgi:O-antigen/teichoic acid export membrane protein
MSAKFIRDGFLFSLTKYSVVFIGLLRTMITAAILTKAQLGSLAAILLVFEYITLISPLGSIYAFNKSIVNLQASKNDISMQNNAIENIYHSTAYIAILGLLFSFSVLYLMSIYTDFMSEKFSNNIVPIFCVTTLSVYRSYAVVHNRVWGKFRKIISMELMYALTYLACISIFLKGDENFLSNYLNILIFSIILSISVSSFIPKLSFEFNLKLFSSDFFKLGIILMAYNFLETFFWGVDRIFIALYLLPEQLADFHIAHTWARGIMMAYMALTFLFTSELMRQVTLTDNKIKNQNIVSKIKQLTKSSEVLLVAILAFALLILPPLIQFTMNKYSNINDILVLVLLGLMLKGLCFFPGSYMIANHLQKRLTFLSIGFSGLASLVYYIFHKYVSSPIEYLSISITIFLIYLVILNFVKDKRVSISNLSELIKYKKLLTLSAVSLISVNTGLFSNYFETRFIIIMVVIILYNVKLFELIANLFKFVKYRDSRYIKVLLLGEK